MNAVSSTSTLGWVRDWLSRSHEPAKGDASRAMSLEHLPVSASVFVIAVVAVGVTVLILQGPRQITHPTEFIALLAASVLASSLRLRLVKLTKCCWAKLGRFCRRLRQVCKARWRAEHDESSHQRLGYRPNEHFTFRMFFRHQR